MRSSTSEGRSDRRPWLRLYRDALHNPKVVMLNDRQHRAWHNCLLMADDAGALPSMRDIACHLRMTLQEAEWVVGELVEAGLVDVDALGDGPCRFVMHDWSAHQYTSDSSTDRVRKHRQKKREDERPRNSATQLKRFSNGGVTAPESDTDSEEDKVLLEERNFEFGFGRDAEADGPAGPALDRLKRRAEGLGLPVDEFSETMARTRPKNRPAYFTTLAVNRLSAQLPLVSDEVLREALWGTDDAFALICNALLEVA